MARYIDADKLKPKTERWNEMDDYDHEREYCRSYYPLSEIENAPTEDVAPIVRGKWLKSDIPDSILSKCSVCGFDCGAYTFKYCPMCGAKMEESGETQ